MPFPPGQTLGMLAKLNFVGKGIKLPVKWQKPDGSVADEIKETLELDEDVGAKSTDCVKDRWGTEDHRTKDLSEPAAAGEKSADAGGTGDASGGKDAGTGEKGGGGDGSKSPGSGEKTADGAKGSGEKSTDGANESGKKTPGEGKKSGDWGGETPKGWRSK